MTSQGSARTRFKRALASGDPLIAKAALTELPRVDLADALAVLLVHRGHPDFERLAIRLHAKLCREVRLTMAEAHLALAALQALGGDGSVAATHALSALFERHGLEAAADLIDTGA